MAFTITPATRQGTIPLIFIWGGTGGGKTRTALELARGIAGPKGRIVVGDSENGRAKLCADLIPGGYSHIDFQPPFTPARYTELLETIEQNADVGIIDSSSHLWSGPDGVLEHHEKILDKMVGDDWSKREAASWRAWKEPKAELGEFKDRLLRHKIPMIVCFRGEEKSQLVKDDRGKNVVITSKTTLPIFDKKLIFEGLIAFEVFQKDGQGGFIRFPVPHGKVSHPSLQRILPAPETERITAAHGTAISQWCISPETAMAPKASVDADRNALAVQLWKLLEPHHKGHKDALPAVEQHLFDEALMQTDERLGTLPVERMRTIIEKLKAKATTTAQPQLV